MFERENPNYIPTEYSMQEYINNALWNDFCKYMKSAYRVIPKFEFSKCSWEYGWNVKFKKVNKNLCTLYPREGYFTILVVIGPKEKELLEEILFSFSSEIKQIYEKTEEGNHQKWLMIDLEDNDKRYEDVKKILDIRNN